MPFLWYYMKVFYKVEVKSKNWYKLVLTGWQKWCGTWIIFGGSVQCRISIWQQASPTYTKEMLQNSNQTPKLNELCILLKEIWNSSLCLNILTKMFLIFFFSYLFITYGCCQKSIKAIESEPPDHNSCQMSDIWWNSFLLRSFKLFYFVILTQENMNEHFSVSLETIKH